ncbi:MAG: diguanylate cyclase [Mycobacterium sp.]|nr:diguanylate cyclase [Mycobacterium sp.]
MAWLSSRWQPGRWQQRPDHYDWLSGYLHARGMSTAARIMMGSIAGSMALCLVALLSSPDGPRGTIPVAMTWIGVVGGLGCAALWMWRWPTERQSLMFGVVSNASIALSCLAHPNPLAGLIGCIAFATIGAYFAFFHSLGVVFYNFGVAAGVALVLAIRLTISGHPVLGLVDLMLVLQVNIAMPLAIRALVNALGVDLLHSDRDPLTGLFNRRSFEHRTLGLLVARETADLYLTIALVDLDRFKLLNDTHGHTAGDRALVRVAHALRANSAKSAVIARSGGEEFLIAHVSPHGEPSRQAQKVCDAIAALPSKVTASVGTASAPLNHNDHAGHPALIARLTADADAAMYRAKRNGGNQVAHHDANDPVS